jgi:excinuclease UvrABC nuclease subunit
MLTKTIQFIRAEFDQLTSPCVYVLKKEDRYLYIGCSGRGFQRVFNDMSAYSLGHENGREKAFMEFDNLEVFFYDTPEEASAVETSEIHDKHPKYNKCRRHICSNFLHA